MIIGIDIGYSSTKTSEGIIFDSAYSKSDGLQSGIEIKINDVNYIVGVGSSCYDVNKINTELTKVCLFTALALSSDDSNFDVVTGLPIAQYKTQQSEFEQYISNNNACEVVYNGVKRVIKINKCKVYAQGAGALYSQYIDGNAIIVDIGSRTCDIALFQISNSKRSLSKYSTLYCGMFQLYSNVISAVNNKFNLSLSPDYAETILCDGLKLNGEFQSLDFLIPIYKNHINELCKELDINYPVQAVPLYLCGGGADILFNVLKQKYSNCMIISDSQFANANGFRKVGEKIWQG